MIMKYIKLFETLFDGKPEGFESVMSQLDLEGFKKLFSETLDRMMKSGQLKSITPETEISFSESGVWFTVEGYNVLDTDKYVLDKIKLYARMEIDPTDLYVSYLMKYSMYPNADSMEFVKTHDEVDGVYTYVETGENFRSIEQLVRTFDWLLGGIYKNNPKAIELHKKVETEKAQRDYKEIYKMRDMENYKNRPKFVRFKGYSRRKK